MLLCTFCTLFLNSSGGDPNGRHRLFGLAPNSLNLFSFKENYDSESEELYENKRFLRHVQGVVSMLNVALDMLGPDLEPMGVALFDLGAKHARYGVLPEQYSILGQALVETLEEILGDELKPKFKNSWMTILEFVSVKMIEGATSTLLHAEDGKKPTMEGKEERQQGIKETETTIMKVPPQPPEDDSPESRSKSKRRQLILEKMKAASLQKGDHDYDHHNNDHLKMGDQCKLSYCGMVEAVFISWDKVKKLPNYTEVAGSLLFRR